MTIDAAWQPRMEHEIGSVEVGKYADLVVLEKDLVEVETMEISRVKIVATMMDGKFRHRDGI